MTWARPPARVKQYTGANPSAPRLTTTRGPLMTITAAASAGPFVILSPCYRPPIPKDAPVRSEDYRRFVAAQPCFGCGIDGFSQAAHPNQGKGLALKTCDLKCFPLCGPHFGLIGCHQQHDLRIDVGRDESREIEAGYVARMERIARAAGRKEFANVPA